MSSKKLAAIVSIAYLTFHFATFVYQFRLWNTFEPLMVAFSAAHLVAPFHALSVTLGGSKVSPVVVALSWLLVVIESAICFLASSSQSPLANDLFTSIFTVLAPFALMTCCLSLVSHPIPKPDMVIVVL